MARKGRYSNTVTLPFFEIVLSLRSWLVETVLPWCVFRRCPFSGRLIIFDRERAERRSLNDVKEFLILSELTLFIMDIDGKTVPVDAASSIYPQDTTVKLSESLAIESRMPKMVGNMIINKGRYEFKLSEHRTTPRSFASDTESPSSIDVRNTAIPTYRISSVFGRCVMEDSSAEKITIRVVLKEIPRKFVVIGSTCSGSPDMLDKRAAMLLCKR